ncbi:MAG: tyrosine-type recombinase/integrase, partial [Dehalococcoidales bacterium]|nr:tyrosine-type recombinase/integrase [Dehalococcoidales bacterium]
NEAREEIPKRKPAATKMNSSTSAVFVNRWGGRLTPRSIQILIQKYADLAQIGKKVHPHMVRHTFATHMLDGGADLRVVQELLGHANLSTTQIYTHISKKRAKQVYLSAHPMAQNDKGAENEHDEQD